MAAVARRQQQVAAVLGSGSRHFMLLKCSRADVIHPICETCLKGLQSFLFKPLLFGDSLSKP